LNCNSRQTDIQWLRRKSKTFLVTSSGSLIQFDRPFGFLIFIVNYPEDGRDSYSNTLVKSSME